MRLIMFLFLLTTSCGLKLRRRTGLQIGGSRREEGTMRSSLPPGRNFDLNSHKARRTGEKVKVSVAVVLPHTTFHTRKYRKMIKQGALSLSRMPFEKAGFELSPYLEMIRPIPAPTEILNKLCKQFLSNNTAAILYLTNSETYGRDTVASQYFMQLAQYVRLPVISWNADNSAFEQGGASLQIQLAPTMKHQARAIISLLERYGWHTFSIVTGTIAGHRNFDQVREFLPFFRILGCLSALKSLDKFPPPPPTSAAYYYYRFYLCGLFP